MSLPMLNKNLVLSDNEVIEIEHIVQFGITIDDEQIKKTIEKNAMQQVVATFRNDIIKEMIGKNNYTKSDYSTMMWNAVHTYNIILTGGKAERAKKKFYNSEYDATTCYCCGEKITIPWTEQGRICKKCQTNDNGKYVPWEV